MCKTAYARIAEQYFSSTTQGRLLATPGFRLPAIFLTVLVLMFALAAFFGADFHTLLSTSNLFLGGIGEQTDVEGYQRGTLLMVSMAALVAWWLGLRTAALALLAAILGSVVPFVCLRFCSINTMTPSSTGRK